MNQSKFLITLTVSDDMCFLCVLSFFATLSVLSVVSISLLRKRVQVVFQ